MKEMPPIVNHLSPFGISKTSPIHEKMSARTTTALIFSTEKQYQPRRDKRMNGLLLSLNGLSCFADAKRWIEVDTRNMISDMCFINFIIRL